MSRIAILNGLACPQHCLVRQSDSVGMQNEGERGREREGGSERGRGKEREEGREREREGGRGREREREGEREGGRRRTQGKEEPQLLYMRWTMNGNEERVRESYIHL